MGSSSKVAFTPAALAVNGIVMGVQVSVTSATYFVACVLLAQGWLTQAQCKAFGLPYSFTSKAGSTGTGSWQGWLNSKLAPCKAKVVASGTGSSAVLTLVGSNGQPLPATAITLPAHLPQATFTSKADVKVSLATVLAMPKTGVSPSSKAPSKAPSKAGGRKGTARKAQGASVKPTTAPTTAPSTAPAANAAPTTGTAPTTA
jgi:hypothetical protein